MSMFKLIAILLTLCQTVVYGFDDQLNFIQHSNELAIKLLNVLPKTQNDFYSPLSITYSLYALLNGANGVTEAELKRLLNIGRDETLDSINEEVKTILKLIEEKNIDQVTVRFANRLLLANSFKLNRTYENTIRNKFNSSVDSVDFFNNALNVTDDINSWISDQTNGKITKLFETLSTETELVAANALYFSAGWEYPFDSADTAEDLFYGTGDQPSNVLMMSKMRKFGFQTNKKLNASLIDLPFIEESLSMIIILPDQRDGLDILLENLDSDTLISATNNLLSLPRSQLILSVPKFELRTDYNLKTHLQALGLSSLFNLQSDLSRITEQTGLKVSQAIHKAVFKVTEEGAEATAAVGLSCTPRIWIPPVGVKVDRPFIFLIQDIHTGLVLFLGKVVNI